MSGTTVKSTREVGLTIRCTGTVTWFGQTGRVTKVNSKMTRGMATVSSFGATVVRTREAGLPENNMARAFTRIRKESNEEVTGRTVGVKDG